MTHTVSACRIFKFVFTRTNKTCLKLHTTLLIKSAQPIFELIDYLLGLKSKYFLKVQRFEEAVILVFHKIEEPFTIRAIISYI